MAINLAVGFQHRSVIKHPRGDGYGVGVVPPIEHLGAAIRAEASFREIRTLIPFQACARDGDIVVERGGGGHAIANGFHAIAAMTDEHWPRHAVDFKPHVTAMATALMQFCHTALPSLYKFI